LDIIRFYYIKGPLHYQKDICGFIAVDHGPYMFDKTSKVFFTFDICCFYTTSVVLMLISIS